MAQSRAVKVTAHFERRLRSIQTFLMEADANAAFDDLLDHLFENVIPNLKQFPEMGVDFLARRCASLESRARIENLASRSGAGQIREYIFGDYLVLYSVTPTTVDLLSIRHHKQLSFDLKSIWL